jgi:hypothetical protein
MPDWMLTSFATGPEYVEEMRNMLETFREHHPDVLAITGSVRDRAGSRGDVLWVDADARFRRPIDVPEGAFDIGAQDYTKNKSRISTGTMWVRRSTRAALLLERWLAFSSPGISNETTLAQVLRNTPAARFYELPLSMTSPCSVNIRGWRGRLEHDSAIIHWNRSRHALGLYKGAWPPPEDVRRNCTHGSPSDLR